ncbi:hypothetical protein CISIN_1g0295971mg, partial [Citrus sinensis]
GGKSTLENCQVLQV